MTAGSVAGVLLVSPGRRCDGLLAFYALWVGIGVVMAAVLYEPAFTVLAKWFPRPGERRRAMTAMTLVGALASFIFLPLAQALIDAYGWRDALLVLAAVLALDHRPAARARRSDRRPTRATPPSTPHAVVTPPARRCGRVVLAALRRRSSWPPRRDRRDGPRASRSCSSAATAPAFAAFAVGLIGVSQIPGRLLFAPLAERLPRPWATAALFALIAAGIALVVGVDATAAVIAGLVLLGMGNGMATLARATAIADRYGAGRLRHDRERRRRRRPSEPGPPRPSPPPPTRPRSATARCSWTLAAIAVLAALLAFVSERGADDAVA